MASIKLKFRPSTIAGKEGTLYYQIIHERKARQLLTDYHVFPSEWDKKRAMLVSNSKSERCPIILSLRENIRYDIDRLKHIIKSFEYTDFDFSADDIINEFRRYSQEYSLFSFTEAQIIKLKQKEKIRTSETYMAALNSFKKFLASQASKDNNRNGEDIMLDSITSDLMEAYETFLTKRNVIPNTVSFYMRILRAIYNRAVEDELTPQRFPFKHVYTGIDRTVKRAVSLKVIKRIKEIDLSLNQSADFARDMFLFSFYTRGMSFIDMAYLKKKDLANGILTYRRRKTGQQLFIKWEKCMQEIVDKYDTMRTCYLLPIIKVPNINERNQYVNSLRLVNNKLKYIANIIHLPIPLSTYVARHAWASIAKSKNIPISVISEGMGHDSEMTTQIYLASLDNSAIDKANEIILKNL